MFTEPSSSSSTKRRQQNTTNRAIRTTEMDFFMRLQTKALTLIKVFQILRVSQVALADYICPPFYGGKVLI